MAHYYYPKSTQEKKTKVKSTVTHTVKTGMFQIAQRMKARFKKTKTRYF